jgi:hypothetical protein
MAISSWQKLCEVPNDQDSLAYAADCIRDSIYRKPAEAVLKEAFKRPEPNVNLGVAWLKLTNFRKGSSRWVHRLQPKDELWRRACFELIGHMHERAAKDDFNWFFRRNRKLFAADTLLWANCGRALNGTNQFRRAVKWLSDWKSRADVTPWMTSNLALALCHGNRFREAADVARESLNLPPDHTTGNHRILIAVLEAIEGNRVVGLEMIRAVQPAQLTEYWQRLYRFVDAALDSLTETREARTSIWKIRQRLLQAYGPPGTVAHDRMVYHIYRRIMKRINHQRRNWLLYAWYTILRMPIA